VGLYQIPCEENAFLWEENDLVAMGMSRQFTQEDTLVTEIKFFFPW